MTTDAIQWAITILVGPASGVGGWWFARRRQKAVTTGVELENEGRAIDLYDRMANLAQDLQDRHLEALAEVDSIRAELQVCISAREEARRERALQMQQSEIDKARSEVELSKLRHEIAALRLQIVALGGGEAAS